MRYARSPPRMTSAAYPLMGGQPRHNVTSFGQFLPNSSETIGAPFNTPISPRFPFHQPRNFQQPHSISSSPDLDYKRVRRKRSLINLTPRTTGAEQRLTNITSLSPSVHSNSPHNFLPPLLPPLFLTPVPRPSTTSPSLSSSVDTLQSTPTQTPIQTSGSPLEQCWSVGRIELTEPIRTKRKFAKFKPAKRLPHFAAHHGGGEGVWEVHAAVVDLNDVDREDLSDLEDEVVDHVTSSNYLPQVSSSETRGSAGKAGRAVHFEKVGKDRAFEGPRVSETARSAAEEETSSYSLSKFKFPAPPGYHWAGTFGELTSTPSATQD